MPDGPRRSKRRKAASAGGPKPIGAVAKGVVTTVLQTFYKGIRYRSRTEARWAVFFDHMELPVSYEPEGFDLDGEWYLPDFYVHDWDLYIEVKGFAPTEKERRKAQALATGTGKRVLVVVGDPRCRRGELFSPDGPSEDPADNAVLATCRRCKHTVIALDWWDDAWTQVPLHDCKQPQICGEKYHHQYQSADMEAAVEAAVNERFGVRP